MDRTKLNFTIDAIGFFGFVLLATTGILIRYVLPPGSGKHTLLWGLSRHEWGTVHFWIAISFFSVLILHLFLHWQWIVCVIRGKKSEKSGFRFSLGLIGFIGILAFAFSPFWSDVEQSSSISNTIDSLDSLQGNEIKGRMTLREIEQELGIPSSYMIEHLGLPPDVSIDIGVAKLGKYYGFNISDVRRIADEYKSK